MTEPTMPGAFVREAPARTEAEIRERHESNRQAWNEGAAASYARMVDEVVDFIRSGQSSLHPVERENIGQLLAGMQRVIHLQCAGGRDTLSFLNEGVAEVVGVDISDVMIESAQRATDALGARATWYRCDLFDTPHDLDGTADLVYTGRGAIIWMQDLAPWAAVVARLLKPGGHFHVLDNHPLLYLFDDTNQELRWSGQDYLEGGGYSQGWPSEYIGDIGKPLDEQARAHERGWPIASVFNALTAAGLRVEYIGEHREGYWSEKSYLPEGIRDAIPLTFSMLARKPQ